jgi:flavin reductase (DIM6/NTAB) family NADH-FMN oxidoreductase RutF
MAQAQSPLVYGCYLVVVQDAGKTHAMVCSWATQVSDRYVLLCIGAQSETGKLLREGTRFSLNVLLREQLGLAQLAGTKHSSVVDKLAGVPVVARDGVVTLQRAKKTMICRVERSFEIAPDNATRGVLAEIVSAPEEQDGDPLLLDDVYRASAAV